MESIIIDNTYFSIRNNLAIKYQYYRKIRRILWDLEKWKMTSLLKEKTMVEFVPLLRRALRGEEIWAEIRNKFQELEAIYLKEKYQL